VQAAYLPLRKVLLLEVVRDQTYEVALGGEVAGIERCHLSGVVLEEEFRRVDVGCVDPAIATVCLCAPVRVCRVERLRVQPDDVRRHSATVFVELDCHEIQTNHVFSRVGFVALRQSHSVCCRLIGQQAVQECHERCHVFEPLDTVRMTVGTHCHLEGILQCEGGDGLVGVVCDLRRTLPVPGCTRDTRTGDGHRLVRSPEGEREDIRTEAYACGLCTIRARCKRAAIRLLHRGVHGVRACPGEGHLAGAHVLLNDTRCGRSRERAGRSDRRRSCTSTTPAACSESRHDCNCHPEEGGSHDLVHDLDLSPLEVE